MPMDMKVEPGTAALTVGNDYANGNRIEFTVTLAGQGRVYLTMELPLGPDGVLRKVEDADRVTFDPPGTAKPVRKAPPGTKKWSLGDYSKGIAVDGTATIRVSIGNVLCTASEGKRKLAITAEPPNEPAVRKEIEITIAKPATAPKNPILYFIAEPTNLIGSGTVTLSWDVVGDQDVVLVPPTWATPVGASTGNRRTFGLGATGTFSLHVVGKTQATPPVTVSVLTSDEWQPLMPLGNKAFPSVIFDSPPGRKGDLYAIFLRGEEREAVLCRSEDGISGWEVINSDVPAGMETSPGVVFNNRLWLIGGSAVDRSAISGRIFHYDLASSREGWKEASAPGFADKVRMGHACAVDGDHIWVLGGVDQYGASLNDVLRLDPDQNGNISAVLSATAPFRARCMFSALNFNNRLLACGGVTSPNGLPLGDMFLSRSLPFEPGQADWKDYARPEELENAIGAGAAMSSSGLYMLMTTRVLKGRAWAGAPEMRQLGSDAETPFWAADGIAPKLKDPVRQWTGTQPHSIGMVGFSNRLYLRYLHRDALYGKQVGAPLFVLPLPDSEPESNRGVNP